MLALTLGDMSFGIPKLSLGIYIGLENVERPVGTARPEFSYVTLSSFGQRHQALNINRSHGRVIWRAKPAGESDRPLDDSLWVWGPSKNLMEDTLVHEVRPVGGNHHQISRGNFDKMRLYTWSNTNILQQTVAFTAERFFHRIVSSESPHR